MLKPEIVACLFIKFWPTLFPFEAYAKFKLFANTLFLVEEAPGLTNRYYWSIDYTVASVMEPICRLIGRFGPNSTVLLHDCDGTRTVLVAESTAASKGL